MPAAEVQVISLLVWSVRDSQVSSCPLECPSVYDEPNGAWAWDVVCSLITMHGYGLSAGRAGA